MGCKKEITEQEIESQSTAVTLAAEAHHIGDPNRTPNLSIPMGEPGWNGDEGLFGLRYAFLTLRKLTVTPYLAFVWHDWNFQVGSLHWFVGTGCPIINAAYPRFNGTDWSSNDFVVCRSCDGISDSLIGGYDFPGMLSLKLFSNRVLVGKAVKENFNVAPIDFANDFYPFTDSVKRYYTGDTMYMWTRTGDTYNNYYPVPEVNGLPVPGLYVLGPKVNPDKAITESNYDDNVATRPIRINADLTVVDDINAMAANIPNPVTFLPPVFNLQGKNKSITISWVPGAYEFKVYRNVGTNLFGVLLADDLYATTFTDTNLPNGSVNNIIYTVIAENEGVGESAPSSLHIHR